MMTTKIRYKHLGAIFIGLAAILQPAEDVTVAQAAENYRYVNQPGAYVGPWLNSTTPYMVEPMNVFGSRQYSGLVFVGSAQCGKTDALILNTTSYCIKSDPMDMMIVCPTMTAARDFSIRRVDRLHRHSKDIGAMLVPGADSDNKYDKHYTTGMLLSLSWPTPTELAGKPIGRVVMTDYDRMPLDVGGDGNAYDLASMRTTTFGSYAMCLAESSPSHPITDLKWLAKRPHEAPPTTGILALYNRGDMRRWYWPCPHCDGYFEGRFEMLRYDSKGSNLERAATVRMTCPLCGGFIEPDDRDEMNQWGIWVKSGQGVDAQGRRFGPSPVTMIASFWLNGVAAAFTNWKKLVAQYLDAVDSYERTGDEEALKKFYNNNLGEPYYPQKLADMRLPEVLKSRAEDGLVEGTVPADTRFLVATVDVQTSSFVVQVFAIMPGMPFDIAVVDRFSIRKSKRLDDDGDPHMVKPSTYSEDWWLIDELVMRREYKINDDSGRLMGIKMTACDSGGEAGVTGKAYEFYRHLRADNRHRRFILVKGDHKPGAPRARLEYPDSKRRDIKAIAKGDVPVLMLSSNLLKDALDGRLDCIVPGKGMYLMPSWLPDWFYNELCAEVRTEKGWQNPAGARNEAWDLSYYAIGLCVSELIRVEHIDWANPPSWAAPIDRNDFVRVADKPAAFEAMLKSPINFSDFGKALA